MQDKIYTLLRDNFGTQLERATGVYNIYPKHIPDNAITDAFPKAVIYNIIQGQVNLTATLYTVQLSIFHRDYGACRELAIQIKEFFNERDFSSEGTGLLSTKVLDIIELEYDTETAYYGVAVNVTFKTTGNW